MLEIDETGLDKSDRNLLSVIFNDFNCGPVGINTLAIAIGESIDTIENNIEPYLIQSGLLQRTPKGRIITNKAIQNLSVFSPE